MSATLSDLDSSTTYSVRTYAKASKSTYYGEEQQFTMPENAGIEGVSVDRNGASGIVATLREHQATSTAWLKIAGAHTDSAEIYILNMSGAMVWRATAATDGS